jgi:hypothetical protein
VAAHAEDEAGRMSEVEANELAALNASMAPASSARSGRMSHIFQRLFYRARAAC